MATIAKRLRIFTTSKPDSLEELRLHTREVLNRPYQLPTDSKNIEEGLTDHPLHSIFRPFRAAVIPPVEVISTAHARPSLPINWSGLLSSLGVLASVGAGYLAYQIFFASNLQIPPTNWFLADFPNAGRESFVSTPATTLEIGGPYQTASGFSDPHSLNPTFNTLVFLKKI